jgi:hypothetical protein
MERWEVARWVREPLRREAERKRKIKQGLARPEVFVLWWAAGLGLSDCLPVGAGA